MSQHRIRKGLDLPLAGMPAQRIEPARAVRQVALLGADAPGLRPSFTVQVGDAVRRGQVLYEDRKRPGLRFTAPAAGTVRAIHRGERRAFVSLVIDVAADDAEASSQLGFAGAPGDPRKLDAPALRALLLESGLWAALRARPFGHVPVPDSVPCALFITAIDTRPHAPDPQVVLQGREGDFALGLLALERLVPLEVPVHLCVAPGSSLTVPPGARCTRHEFDGPHPAGTPGLHMHLLHPVGPGRTAWHIGYQDVAAIGHLLATGRLEVERVISLAGPLVQRPRLLRTRLGASIGELTAGELQPGECRVLSGSALDGRIAQGPGAGEGEAFLGRHHLQICALAEGRERELFGWITPQTGKYSVWNVVAGRFAALRQAHRASGLPLTTTTNGGSRAMVPIGSYERVLPMDIMATHLLRALITGDAEQAVALGALELEEEDLALATFVCPGKTEYGPLLRRLLDRVEKEGV